MSVPFERIVWSPSEESKTTRPGCCWGGGAPTAVAAMTAAAQMGRTQVRRRSIRLV
jgi:hypothetical protein